MVRNFVRWMLRPVQFGLPQARGMARLLGASPRRRRRYSGVSFRTEPLEERLVLTTTDHIFNGGGEYPVLQASSNVSRTFSVYEDLTGDGFTADDVLFPFSIPVTISSYTRTAAEIQTGGDVQQGTDRWAPNDTFSQSKSHAMIANGGVLQYSSQLKWDDLDGNLTFDTPDYNELVDGKFEFRYGYPRRLSFAPGGAWTADHIIYEHSVAPNPDLSNLFPAGQTWILTSDAILDGNREVLTYVREVTVRGSVYEDRNGNGRRDSGEPPYQVNVFLDRNKDGILNEPDRDVANKADGTIEMKLRGQGEIGIGYRDLPEFLTITEGLHKYSTSDEGNLANVTFGVFKNGQVTGVVFNDPNRDGKWHPAQGELGFPGVTVRLESNGKTQSKVTDANGVFHFFAGPGDYQLSQDLSGLGVTQALPADPDGYSGEMTKSSEFDQYTFSRTQAKDIAITGAALNGKTAVGFDFTATGNTETYTIGVYQSADTVYQGSDKLLASLIVNPENGQSGHAVLSLPDNYQHSYTLPNLLVVADPQNKVKEADEKNNLQVVGGGKKDIAITNATRSGTSIGFDFTSKGNTGPFTIGVYQSLDTFYQSTDKLVASLIVDPADGQSGHAVLSLPDNYKTDPAKPQLIVMADPGNQIKEDDEKNNVQTARGGNVLLKDAHYLGSKDKVQVTTTSGGDETPYFIGLFRSANATYEANLDKLVATQTLPTAGTHEITFKPPADDPKLPYLIAVLDPQRGIGADAADRIKVVEAPPDVRLTAKFENGQVKFNTAFVTQLAQSASALAAAKKIGVAPAKGGADGTELDESQRYSVGVYFSADKVFDAGDRLARGLTSITNSHQSGSVDVSDLPPSLAQPYILVAANAAAGIKDYDVSDNATVAASWEGPAVLQGAVNAAKQTLATAKSKIEAVAPGLYDALSAAVKNSLGNPTEQLHLMGQAVVKLRQQLTEGMIEQMAIALQITDASQAAGRAVFDRVGTYIDDNFDTMLRPLLPKSLIDAGTAISEQTRGFVDQYVQPLTEAIIDTGYTIVTANPIRLELAEKIFSNLEAFEDQISLEVFELQAVRAFDGTLEHQPRVAVGSHRSDGLAGGRELVHCQFPTQTLIEQSGILGFESEHFWTVLDGLDRRLIGRPIDQFLARTDDFVLLGLDQLFGGAALLGIRQLLERSLALDQFRLGLRFQEFDQTVVLLLLGSLRLFRKEF
jgi:hypothetical protein